MLKIFLLSAVLSVWAEVLPPSPILITNQEGKSGGRLRLPCSSGLCMIDTGGRGNMISANDASMLYPKTGEVDIDTVQGRYRCDVVGPLLYALAGKSFQDVKMVRCAILPESLSPMLGIPFFDGQRFRLSFSRAEFAWDTGVLPLPYPVTRHMGWFSVQAIIGGITMEAVYDTGAPYTLIDKSFFLRHRELFEPLSPENTGFQLAQLVQPLRISDFVLANRHVMVLDLKASFGAEAPDVFLGMNHIIQLDWAFDLKENSYSVRPAR